MAALIGLLVIGVVAVIIKDILESGTTGTADIKAVGSDVSGFYSSLSYTSQGK